MLNLAERKSQKDHPRTNKETSGPQQEVSVKKHLQKCLEKAKLESGSRGPGRDTKGSGVEGLERRSQPTRHALRLHSDSVAPWTRPGTQRVTHPARIPPQGAFRIATLFSGGISHVPLIHRGLLSAPLFVDFCVFNASSGKTSRSKATNHFILCK